MTAVHPGVSYFQTRDDFLGQLELSVKDIAIQEYDSTVEKICPLQPRSCVLESVLEMFDVVMVTVADVHLLIAHRTRSRVLGDLVLRVCRLPSDPSESDIDELRLGEGSNEEVQLL